MGKVVDDAVRAGGGEVRAGGVAVGDAAGAGAGAFLLTAVLLEAPPTTLPNSAITSARRISTANVVPMPSSVFIPACWIFSVMLYSTFVVIPVMMTVGWRAAFYLLGALGIIWAIVWWLYYKDTIGTIGTIDTIGTINKKTI